MIITAPQILPPLDVIEPCPSTLDVASLFTQYLSTMQVSESHSSDLLTDAQQVLETVHHSLSAELANSTRLSAELANSTRLSAELANSTSLSAELANKRPSDNCSTDVVESGRKGAWLDEAVCGGLEVKEGGVCVEVGGGEGTSEVEGGECGDIMPSHELEDELLSRQVRCDVVMWCCHDNIL